MDDRSRIEWLRSPRSHWLRANPSFCFEHVGQHMAFHTGSREVVALGVNLLDVFRKLTAEQRRDEAIVFGEVPSWDEIRPMNQDDALQWATEVGIRSPCAKSKRGVVIWHPDLGRIAGGYNHQPPPWKCTNSALCRQICNNVCVHAEAHALVQAGPKARGADLLHVKVMPDGRPVPSGPPSCWQCSRLILAAGIEHVWLLHAGGLRSYDAVKFHRLTLKHHELDEPADTEGPR